MKHSAHAVAENLREIREQRNLSLEQVAERTGVSKSMLRKIEIGASSPTIGTIWKIANGLKLSFTSLLQEKETEVVVSSFRQAEPLTEYEEHYRVYPMVPFSPEEPFETYFIEIDPDTAFRGEPHEGNVYEYLYVTKGVLEVFVADRTFVVKQDEYIRFHANCSHGYRCVGDATATAIMKISYIP